MAGTKVRTMAWANTGRFNQQAFNALHLASNHARSYANLEPRFSRQRNEEDAHHQPVPSRTRRPAQTKKRGRTSASRYTPQSNLAASSPQVQIDPFVKGYGIAVATGLPVAGHAGLHKQPLALVVVVSCHLGRQCGSRPHSAHSFCQDENARGNGRTRENRAH